MKALRILLLCEILLLSQEKYLGESEEGLPIFTIDMNLPPKERFKETATYMGQKSLNYYKALLNRMDSWVVSIFKYGYHVLQYTNPELYEELVGISEALHVEPYVPILVNYLVEIDAFCTSAITKKQDGTIIHSRNLDYD